MPEYSKNQMHGKSFENMIKAAGVFGWAAADRKRTPNDRFDLGSVDDGRSGLPTSIKSTKSNMVGLSDARQFWRSFDSVPYRLPVGSYSQQAGFKVFGAIHEILLRESYRAALLGRMTEAKVEQFHNGLKTFGTGRDGQIRASAWARERKRELRPDTGLVTLNPKIDSKNQRRLQCSVRLSKLIEMLDADDYVIHTNSFGTLALPLRIVSGKRN